MTKVYKFEISSILQGDSNQIWSTALTPDGINAEFKPLARMTFPSAIPVSAEELKLNTKLFRSWILLFGFIPIDYDDIMIIEYTENYRFLERSKMLSQRVWQHERTIKRIESGCLLTDRVEFLPKLNVTGVVMLPIYRMFFKLRHHNLRNMWGGSGLPKLF